MISLDKLTDYGAHCVRYFTPGQFDDCIAAKRALDALVNKQHFAKTQLVAVAISQIELLYTFTPECGVDQCEPLASVLHRRWLRYQPAPISVYWATKRTVQLLGGHMPGRLPSIDHATHDLGMSTLALKLFATEPAMRHAWRPEELFKDVYGQAKPDAALADDSGITAYIEFAGRYTCERLRRLQQFAIQTRRPLYLYTAANPS